MESKKYNKIVNIQKSNRLTEIKKELVGTGGERDLKRGNIGSGY